MFLKFGLDFYRKLFSAGDERVDQTGERSRNSGRALLYDLGRQRTQRTKGLRSTALTIFLLNTFNPKIFRENSDAIKNIF